MFRHLPYPDLGILPSPSSLFLSISFIFLKILGRASVSITSTVHARQTTTKKETPLPVIIFIRSCTADAFNPFYFFFFFYFWLFSWFLFYRFIYAFLGLGIVVCFNALAGHTVSNCIETIALSIVSFSICMVKQSPQMQAIQGILLSLSQILGSNVLKIKSPEQFSEFR